MELTNINIEFQSKKEREDFIENLNILQEECMENNEIFNVIEHFQDNILNNLVIENNNTIESRTKIPVEDIFNVLFIMNTALDKFAELKLNKTKNSNLNYYLLLLFISQNNLTNQAIEFMENYATKGDEIFNETN